MLDSQRLRERVGVSVSSLSRNRTATDSALLFTSTIVQAGVGVLCWAVAARLYGVSAVGLTSAVVSAAFLIAAVSGLGFPAMVIRYLPISGTSGRMLCVVSCIIPALLALTVAFLISSLPLPLPLSADLRQQGIAGLLIPSTLAAATAVGLVQDSIFVARRQSYMVLVRGTALVVVRLALLGPFTRFGAFGLIGTFAIGAVVAVVLGFPAWRDFSYPAAQQKLPLRALSAYSGSSYLSGLLSQTPQLLYPIIVASGVSHKAAGAFAFAWMAAFMLMTLPPSVGNVMMAHAVHNPLEARQYIARATRAMVGLTALLCLITWVVVRMFAGLLIPAAAQDVVTYQPILLASVVLYTLVRLQSMSLAYHGKLRALLVQNGSVALVAVVMPLALVPHYKVLGLEIGWTVAQAVGIVLGQFFMRTHQASRSTTMWTSLGDVAS